MKTGTICLLSGGIDSLVSSAWARIHCPPPFLAMSIRYNSLHNSAELQRAKRIAQELDMPHIIIDQHLPSRSALTDFESGRERLREFEDDQGLATSFVPGRNILFLAQAAIIAYMHNAHHIVLGVSLADRAGFPDCRISFLDSMIIALREGFGGYDFNIHAPLNRKDILGIENDSAEDAEIKANIIRLAKALGVGHLLPHTYSCYSGVEPPCGYCQACTIRRKAFEMNEELERRQMR